jgi:NAD(P)-dependent dehydrogenase (short-subunit alcohol dehydrogenase family)
MRTKGQIHKEYLKNNHEALLKNIIENESPRTAIFGYQKNNIGHGIAQELVNKNKRVQFFTEEEWDLLKTEEREVIKGCDNGSNFQDFDYFVFNNGYTHLDWIENLTDKRVIEIINKNLIANIISLNWIVRKSIACKNFNEKNSWKKIVFIGSMAYKNVLNGSSVYCAAKAGLNHFVKCAAYELAPKGFQIFCVNPSNVQDSPMSEKTIQDLKRYRDLTDEEAKAYWSAECPLGNFLTKKEIAEVVVDLLMQDRKYLSGSCIDLAGGQR